MSHATEQILTSKIASKPPARTVNDRFWVWLQEQLEKIKVEIAGRHQLFHVHDVAITNPALAGEQLLHEETIDAGIFSLIYADRISLKAFGALANNANTKTITVKVNGTAVLTRSVTFANVNWYLENEIFIRPTSANMLSRGSVHMSGQVETIGANGLAIDPMTTDITIGIYGTSSAAAAADISMYMFILESARTQRS